MPKWASDLTDIHSIAWEFLSQSMSPVDLKMPPAAQQHLAEQWAS